MRTQKTEDQYFYAWHHRETGERLGWVFKSSVAARQWLQETYWRYYKYKRIDEYFATLRSDPVRKFSAKYWYRDKDVWQNYKLEYGRLDYSKRKKGKSLKLWESEAIQQVGDRWVVSFTWKGGKWNLGKFKTIEEAKQALKKRLEWIGAFGGRK